MTEKLSVVHIAGGGVFSGAGRGILNLHEGLLELGVNSKILLVSRQSDVLDDPNILVYLPSGIQHYFGSAVRFLDRQISLPRRVKGTTFTAGVIGASILDSNICRDADIVNIHWLKGTPSIQAIGGAKKPIVVTMRDMWSFTGGCHYSNSCERYKIGCGYCPAFDSKIKYDRSRLLHFMKRRKWRLNRNIYPIGISPWITDQANQSKIFENNKCKTIWNGIDLRKFTQIAKSDAKNKLNLSEDTQYIAMGSMVLTPVYKGGEIIESIFNEMQRLFDRKVKILLFGSSGRRFSEFSENVIQYGLINDDKKLNLIYAASSVFLLPSIQEAFGKTIIESLASGTPVVAFDSSGPANILRNTDTGYLAKPFSVMDLVVGIEKILTQNKLVSKRQSNSCVELSKRFSNRKSAQEYYKLYNKILSS